MVYWQGGLPVVRCPAAVCTAGQPGNTALTSDGGTLVVTGKIIDILKE
jgi:hypothetical protein